MSSPGLEVLAVVRNNLTGLGGVPRHAGEIPKDLSEAWPAPYLGACAAGVDLADNLNQWSAALLAECAGDQGVSSVTVPTIDVANTLKDSLWKHAGSWNALLTLTAVRKLVDRARGQGLLPESDPQEDIDSAALQEHACIAATLFPSVRDVTRARPIPRGLYLSPRGAVGLVTIFNTLSVPMRSIIHVIDDYTHVAPQEIYPQLIAHTERTYAQKKRAIPLRLPTPEDAGL